MSSLRNFAYAQARIQARYGQRPSEAVWRQLSGAGDFVLYLEHARASKLRPWVASFSFSTEAHDMEARLRAAMRTLIGEVADWLPREWGPAVRWTVHLTTLSAVLHLSRGGEVHPWMRHDEGLAPLLAASPGASSSGFAGIPASIAQALAHGDWLLDAWLAEWRRLWPPMGERERRSLERLASVVRSHLWDFAHISREHAWEVRRTLEQKLSHLFRRIAFEPAAAFVYLALVALDLERLRAALVGRALYPHVRGVP
ncbi:MAG: hypothetical protein ABIR56_03325 [Polaromonas sp.]